MMVLFALLLTFWWGVTAITIAVLIKMKQYRKTHPALTKAQKENIKKLKEKEKYRNSKEYKQKYFSEVEVENAYFGKGVLLKSTENPNEVCYTNIESGFDKIFDSFDKKSDDSCDLHEFIVKENNIDYVLTSLEKIYKKSDEIMEKCYDKIYKDIVKFFEDNSGSDWEICLRDDFDLDYLKKNWRLYGVSIYDEDVHFSIGIKTAKNPEHDSFYDITIFVDYDTLEPEVSFDIVW